VKGGTADNSVLLIGYVHGTASLGCFWQAEGMYGVLVLAHSNYHGLDSKYA
jgi:hypothetical protein